MDETLIVYQVMNLEREEVFYGTTATSLNDEILRLAKDPRSPAKQWKRGEAVAWRPLSVPLDPDAARLLHREFEMREPPNKFKVLKTYKE